MSWDFDAPHIIAIKVANGDIDAFGHVNNAVYVRWLEDCAWSHSNNLGLDLAKYQALDRALVVVRHEIDYLAAALLDDELELATWIAKCDSKLKLMRLFQLQRKRDGVTLLRAQTQFACIEISSGRPKRMPAAFVDGYSAAVLGTMPPEI